MKPHEVVELFRKRLPLATFTWISVNHGCVGFITFQYGINEYEMYMSRRLEDCVVRLITSEGPIITEYTKRLHQILMGWKRDDAGNMHPPKEPSSKAK